MQLQRDIRILGGILAGAVHIHLIERDLLGALAGHILEGDGLDAEILARGGVHVVARRDAVEHV